MNAFTIKDLENLSGIKAHTIRIWEQRYSFLRPNRSKTNIRYYCDEELKMVLNIALLNKYGYKISHINKMTADAIKEKIASIPHADAIQERQINELLQFLISMDMDKFEELLDRHINKKGIDDAISYLIFPFLHKIGILWLTDHITVAQEHLVSNVIRQKLILGIENCRPPLQKDKTVALFLPAGDHHEIGLLYLQYLAKSYGLRVLYLGANVPIDEIVYVVNAKTPDCIFTHITSVPVKLDFDEFLTALHKRIPQTPVIISGQASNAVYKKIPANIYFKKSLAEVREYLARL